MASSASTFSSSSSSSALPFAKPAPRKGYHLTECFISSNDEYQLEMMLGEEKSNSQSDSSSTKEDILSACSLLSSFITMKRIPTVNIYTKLVVKLRNSIDMEVSSAIFGTLQLVIQTAPKFDLPWTFFSASDNETSKFAFDTFDDAINSLAVTKRSDGWEIKLFNHQLLVRHWLSLFENDYKQKEHGAFMKHARVSATSSPMKAPNKDTDHSEPLLSIVLRRKMMMSQESAKSYASIVRALKMCLQYGDMVSILLLQELIGRVLVLRESNVTFYSAAVATTIEMFQTLDMKEQTRLLETFWSDSFKMAIINNLLDDYSYERVAMKYRDWQMSHKVSLDKIRHCFFHLTPHNKEKHGRTDVEIERMLLLVIHLFVVYFRGPQRPKFVDDDDVACVAMGADRGSGGCREEVHLSEWSSFEDEVVVFCDKMRRKRNPSTQLGLEMMKYTVANYSPL